MGRNSDLERYRVVGEEQREDLADFIRHADMGASDESLARIPIKIIDLPEFVYDEQDAGGVVAADGDSMPDVGDPVDVAPSDGDGDGDGDRDGDDAGSGSGDHDYYEMDPEEFAAELDDELGLDLDPKGKQVVETVDGDFTEVSRRGPNSTLLKETLFKRGLKRKLAFSFDEEYARAALGVAGNDVRDTFQYLRAQSVPVSYDWLQQAYAEMDAAARTQWESVDELEANCTYTDVGAQIRREGLEQVPFRAADKRYRHPEVVEEKQKNVVVVNIRDVSGSMRDEKRDLVERTFAPLDWYLQGKYDNAEFVYIAHDSEAWEVERNEFFGIRSSGGTKISSAYELARERLADYPWSEWNRYVFAAGDGENATNNTREHVIPIMRDIDVNKQAYLQTRPNIAQRRRIKRHGYKVKHEFSDNESVIVRKITAPDYVPDAIKSVLS